MVERLFEYVLLRALLAPSIGLIVSMLLFAGPRRRRVGDVPNAVAA